MAKRGKYVMDWASLIVGTGAGLTLALYVETLLHADFDSLNSIVTSLSRIFALMGSYFALVVLVLVSRISWIEKSVGHDRLVQWHRKLAPYSLYLIAAHVLFVLFGYAANDGFSIGRELWTMTWHYSWMLPAVVAFLFFMAAGITSYKRVRRQMSYETWWSIHIYTYLGITLSFMHQLLNGPIFAGHPLNKAYWIALYAITIVTIIYWRVAVPTIRSFKHGLRVSAVINEGNNITSIVMTGRKLKKLKAQGGQFFSWRFFTPGQWWVAHPYSLSAAPTDTEMRITIKNLGDASGGVSQIPVGTKVFFEGPYGIFTASKATKGLGHAVLVAGGVGITPIRALMEEFDASIEVDLLFRASSKESFVLKDELDQLAKSRNANVHYLVGSRKDHPMNASHIMKYVPALQFCDVYVCGPTQLVESVREAAIACGIPKERFHAEAFEYHGE